MQLWLPTAVVVLRNQFVQYTNKIITFSDYQKKIVELNIFFGIIFCELIRILFFFKKKKKFFFFDKMDLTKKLSFDEIKVDVYFFNSCVSDSRWTSKMLPVQCKLRNIVSARILPNTRPAIILSRNSTA